jgi:hypothetical protein
MDSLQSIRCNDYAMPETDLFKGGASGHPASYTMGTRFASPGVERQGSDTPHLHLVPKLIMVWLQLHSPIHFHDEVLS